VARRQVRVKGQENQEQAGDIVCRQHAALGDMVHDRRHSVQPLNWQ